MRGRNGVERKLGGLAYEVTKFGRQLEEWKNVFLVFWLVQSIIVISVAALRLAFES
jgi:hypothetical protein